MVNWTSNIKLHPWVGDNYHAGVSIYGKQIKILLVGESHNADFSDDRKQGTSFTQDSIHSYLSPPGSPGRRWSPAPYWIKLGKVIAGSDRYDPQAFWHSIAFYNYLQSFKQVNNHPKREEYAASRNAFIEVIQVLEPDKIVILSKRLWSHVSDLVDERGFWINHPSRISYARWHPIVMQNLS